MSDNDDIFAEAKPPEENWRLKLAVTDCMRNRSGRRFVWEILSQSGLFRLSFNPDPVTMGFNDGNRNVGLWIKTLLDQYCPNEFLTMIKEAQEDETYDRQQREQRKSKSE